jgi:hemoglobin
MTTETLFQKLGGADAVTAATEIFYKKVLSDSLLKPFFEGVDMKRQVSKQKAFLTMAFGGPNRYKGKSLEEGHAHLVKQGLGDEHFDAVIGHLGATLTELEVPEDLIGEAAAIALSTRDAVLGRVAPDPLADWPGWEIHSKVSGHVILKDRNGSPRVMISC